MKELKLLNSFHVPYSGYPLYLSSMENVFGICVLFTSRNSITTGNFSLDY
jgi:hypothetical protein